MREFSIAGRSIASHLAPYVIAEISASHRGHKHLAIELIHAAKQAGADAVKFQHYSPDTITVRSDHPDFRVTGGTLWDGAQLADLYAEAMTPWEWTGELVEEAMKLRLTWFSTPFDQTAVEFLAPFDPPAYKIASFEIIDLDLVRHVASTGRPIIISTGMATLGEIDAAVTAARRAGAVSIALLRCNSGYPARVEEMDLAALPIMAATWRVPVGLSDHTRGHTAAVTAVALGACIIEKHLTIRRVDGGPDAAFSAEPDELADLVCAVKEAHGAIGSVRFGPSQHELPSLAFRRSLRAVRPLAAGDVVSNENVRSVRPAGGLDPSLMHALLGMVANRDIRQGEPIAWTDVRPSDRELGRRLHDI